MSEGQWGAENFKKITGLNFSEVNGLSNAVAALPVAAKKAMYAAASARTIKRRTWNGCAWNQALIGVGSEHTQGSRVAAAKFGCSVAVVDRFIRFWDSLRARDDDDATRILREKLEEVGIFTEPTAQVQIVSYTVWKDEQRALVEEFAKELAENDFLCDGLEEAGQLLFA